MGFARDLQRTCNGFRIKLNFNRQSCQKKTLVPLIANKTGLLITFLSIVFGSGKKKFKKMKIYGESENVNLMSQY